MVSASSVQPLKRDIDGGKADVFIHEFRPPKRPGTYTMVVRPPPFSSGGSEAFKSDTITLKVREPISFGTMEYAAGKLKICIGVEPDELYALLPKYSVRLEGRGFMKTYPVDTPKRRKRSLSCESKLQVSIPTYDLHDQESVSVVGIFETKNDNSKERNIGILELKKSSDKTSFDFWKFVKTNWKILSICVGGGILLIIGVTLLGCYLKKKQEKKENSDYDPRERGFSAGHQQQDLY